ncbi:unnamed protein product [Ranitomeya imitator]|uniref:tRNA:m(4)X modification enzyme TRM13 n=1 Tax=Ranitomeya imitator TaxID=111125 RepID=A0ABN9MEW9_9NEOB|nr:unnamed protein product [Ranitomeya imitator]
MGNTDDTRMCFSRAHRLVLALVICDAGTTWTCEQQYKIILSQTTPCQYGRLVSLPFSVSFVFFLYGADLALRCLVRSHSNSDGEPQSKRSRTDMEHTITGGPTGHCNVHGIVIALCCHHRCDWQHYVGRDFFEKLGLGQREFGLFQRMSSWATCGARNPSQGEKSSGKGDSEDMDMEEHDMDQRSNGCNAEPVQGLQFSVEEREHLGRLCKLLINRGRVDYLEKMGYEANLEYYTEPEVSLENVILTAAPRLHKLNS